MVSRGVWILLLVLSAMIASLAACGGDATEALRGSLKLQSKSRLTVWWKRKLLLRFPLTAWWRGKSRWR